MTTATQLAGNYVSNTQATVSVGTFTGIPATTRGSYIAGTNNDTVGRYTQTAHRPTAGRKSYSLTATAPIRSATA